MSLDSNDPFTVECAYKKRLLRDLPKVDSNTLKNLSVFIQDFLDKHVPQAEPLAFEEWLETTSYNQARKDELRLAYAELRGGRPTPRQCSHIDSFVKSEAYTTWKHARMINSRCDAFKAWSGPMFKAIEEVVYRLEPFIKHTPVPDRPALIKALRRDGCIYYATDYTAFESHFTPEVMNHVECMLYRHCLRYSNDAEYLCEAITGLNRMRTRTGFSATVKGRRMSGDMCTSLGNGFTNLMLTLYIVHMKHGEVHGYVEGDDGIFSSTVALTAEDYQKLGFTIKIEEIPDPCRASFCGMIFGEDGDIIKDPVRVMSQFAWTSSMIHGQTPLMNSLLRAKALSLRYEVPNCPIVSCIALKALEDTKGSVPRFVDDGYHRPHDEQNVPVFHPPLSTRELFSDVFGITIPVQLYVEKLIMNGEFEKVSQILPPPSEMQVYCDNYVVPF